jgi:hypothetical protein
MVEVSDRFGSGLSGRNRTYRCDFDPIFLSRGNRQLGDKESVYRLDRFEISHYKCQNIKSGNIGCLMSMMHPVKLFKLWKIL